MVKRNPLVFHSADIRKQITDKLILILILQMMIRQDLPHKLIALLIRDNIAALKMVRVFEHHKKDGVERSKRHLCPVGSGCRKKTLFHLLRRCAGKCDDQNIRGLHMMLLN